MQLEAKQPYTQFKSKTFLFFVARSADLQQPSSAGSRPEEEGHQLLRGLENSGKYQIHFGSWVLLSGGAPAS